MDEEQKTFNLELEPSSYPVTLSSLGFERSGLYVSSVVEGHPAFEAGIQVGDKILSIKPQTGK